MSLTAGPDPQTQGFSLVELFPVLVLTLVVVGALAEIIAPSLREASLEPESLDVQQRVRGAADAIRRDVQAAGAGSDRGPMVGALNGYVSAVLPRRIGLRDADDFGIARVDALTILSIPRGAPQSVLTSEATATSLNVATLPGCAAGQPQCGIRVNSGLIVFDALARFRLFTVLDVDAGRIDVRQRSTSPDVPFASGAFVAEITARTYYLDRANHQLRRYDTDTTDVPVVDGITDFTVGYWGHTLPPRRPRPPSGEANCLFTTAGVEAPLPTLGIDEFGLTELTSASLSDGPWCGTGDTAFDADLLRVRRLRIRLRGARSGFTLTFDVAPRNLQAAP